MIKTTFSPIFFNTGEGVVGPAGSELGAWNNTYGYSANALVNRKGTIYKALSATTGDDPETSPLIWEVYMQADELPVDNTAFTGFLNGITGDAQSIFDRLDEITNPLLFKGGIALASDFPDPANVEIGWFYRVTANVTDNDVTKTNTGQSFLAGEEIAWNGTDWTDLGSVALWLDDSTDLKAVNSTRNLDLQSGGLKDTNVTTAVTLGDASNTTFDTTNQTIIGAVNELSEGVEYTNMYFVSKNGDDTNDGTSEEKAKLTIQDALDETSSGDLVKVLDNGSYDEAMTPPTGVSIYAPQATFSSTGGNSLTLEDGVYTFDVIEGNNNNNLVINNPTSDYGILNVNTFNFNGTGFGVRNQVNRLLDLRVKQFFNNSTGVGIADFTAVTAHTHIMLDDIYMTSTGTGIEINNGGEVVGSVQHASNNGGGTGLFLDIADGSCDLNCNLIEADINIGASGTANLKINKMTGDINIVAGGTLYINCPEFTGSLSNNGTIKGRLGDDFYGDLTTDQALDVGGALSAYGSFTLDTGAGDNSEIIIQQDGSDKGKLYYFNPSSRIQLTNSTSGASLVINDSGSSELTSNGGSITLDSTSGIFLEGGAGGKVESNISIDIASGKEYQIDGTSINTGGTLDNVAYLDQAQTFSDDQTFGSEIKYTGTQSVTGTDTLDADVTYVRCNPSADFTFTMTAATGSGRIVIIKNTDLPSGTNYAITIDGQTATDIDGANTYTLNNGDSVTFIDGASGRWDIIG